MTFTGFTIPDGAWLPPELINLIPNIGDAKLRILIVVIYQNYQVGRNEPLSLTEIQKLTGLARSTVVENIQVLIHDKFLEREKIGQSYAYQPVISTSSLGGLVQSNQYDSQSQLRESDSKLNIKNSLSDSLNLTKDKIELVRELRQAGIYFLTAKEIADEHTRETIQQHLDYYRYALRANIARGPGYLVMSLKENWGPPLGYQPDRSSPEARKRYADWNNV